MQKILRNDAVYRALLDGDWRLACDSAFCHWCEHFERSYRFGMADSMVSVHQHLQQANLP
ncbi:MAG: hypothetical protein J6K85_03345 [Clostridia bacterium]|nr:hypothetical protein [Clostridia bacterium]